MSEETSKSPINWFSFLPKFDFRLPLPLFDAEKPPAPAVDEGQNQKALPNDDAQRPEFVRFPKADVAVASVEAEADVSGKTSNPAVIWQVYALGGFLILSWAWARWKERSQRRPNDDEDDEDSSNI